MPVTAKLSLLFYEKLGEQVATELVDWFNSVDAAYRSDLRELNELNFARFDAKLEQRVAQLDAKLERRLADLRAEMERRFTLVDARFESLEAKLLQRLEARIDGAKGEMLRWMFVLWTGNVLAILAARLFL
jgi:hypothetical protein